MPDVLKQLFTAYNDDITAQRLSGQPLDMVRSHFVVQSPRALPPDLSVQTPTLVVYVQPVVVVEPLSIPCYMYDKTIDVVFQVYLESAGRVKKGLLNDDKLCDILDTLENLYHADTFDLTDWCNPTQKDYTNTQAPPMAGHWTVSGSLTIQHRYTDVKSTYE